MCNTQSVKSVHFALSLFGTFFVGGTKIDKVTGNTVSKISHFNLNVTCSKGLHCAIINIIVFLQDKPFCQMDTQQ